jgi:hypothetical protein
VERQTGLTSKYSMGEKEFVSEDQEGVSGQKITKRKKK